MKIDGACHCGQVTFTAEVDPGRVAVCHCTDCQVLSGAPLRAVVVAPIETFVLRGETRSYVKVADSGNRRARCSARSAGRRSMRPRPRTRRRSRSASAA